MSEAGAGAAGPGDAFTEREAKDPGGQIGGSGYQHRDKAASTCWLLPENLRWHCYEPGQFCSTARHGETGGAGNGEAIKCETTDLGSILHR